MQRENCVLVIAGPSAVGKTVVAKAIVESDPRFTFLRSGTTRSKRGDAHDDEYLYYTEDEFLDAVAQGEFAEHMRYGGNLYGTPKSELRRAISEGKIPLLVLDLVGVESMASLSDYSACSVYVYTDIAVIDSRLRARCFLDGETDDSKRLFEARCERNRSDYSTIDRYSDYIYRFIENSESIEDCRDRIKAAFESFCLGAQYEREENTRIAKSLVESVE